MGALVVDASAFEEIEADRQAAVQAVAVVAMVCVASGLGAMGPGAVSLSTFTTGALVALGAWLVWAAVIITLGTVTVPEPQTRSNLPELLRVLGFASAPGVFIALAAMRSAAPFVLVVVTTWMIAGAVIGVRQALDYRSTPRAIAVCAVAFLLSSGVVFAALMIFSTKVS